MFDRIFRPRIAVQVVVMGMVDRHLVRFQGVVKVAVPATVGDGLKAAGRAAGVDLLGAISKGDQPVILLDGFRLDLPDGLTTPLKDGASLSWLLPMAGG